MNRQLKFRAFDTKEKKWLYHYKEIGGFDLKGELILLGEYGSGLPLIRFLNDVEITQFTGMLDKNRKEIYEGDRISFTINFSDEQARAYWSEDGFTGVVLWNNLCWSVDQIVFQKMFNSEYVFSMQEREFDQRLLQRYSKIKRKSFSDITNIEIIGNVFENVKADSPEQTPTPTRSEQ